MLGLIQVMKHLEDIKEVGRGIAVAFVATVYGVAAANLFFLPAANKIKARVQNGLQMKELMLEGVIGIVEGLNPKLIRSKLSAYIREPAAERKPRPPKRRSRRAPPAGAGSGGESPEHVTPKKARSPGKSRTLAGFLRGLHHSAVRLLRGDVCLLADG